MKILNMKIRGVNLWQRIVKSHVKPVNAEFNSGIQSMNQAITSLNKEFGVQKEQMKLTASSSEKYKLVAKLNRHEITVQKAEADSERGLRTQNDLWVRTQRGSAVGNKLLDAERNEARLGNAITVANGKLAESKASMSETAQASERNKQAIADLEAEQQEAWSREPKAE